MFHLQQAQRKEIMDEVNKHSSSPMYNMVVLASVADNVSRRPECSIWKRFLALKDASSKSEEISILYFNIIMMN